MLTRLGAHIAIIAAASCGLTTPLRAQTLELPWLFADHMVLQRDTPVPVWGMAKPGSRIEVAFADQTKQAVAAPDGRWKVMLAPMAASATPRDLTIRSSSASRRTLIRNVLVGEVWLAAGQSNMWYPLKSCTGGNNAAAKAGNPNLRLLNRRANAYPAGGAWGPETLAMCTYDRFYSGTWAEDSQQSALAFSGVAYWFGNKLQQELKVPVGLINVAVGGTTTEAYTSAAGLRSHPLLKPIVNSGIPWFDNEHVSEWPRQRGLENLSGWMNHQIPPMPRHPFEPTFLFESAIQPLVPMAFTGVIWYQGESNATSADNKTPVPKVKVRAGIETMIKDWRSHWGCEFPFFYVQLPGMGRPWEQFREVQLECLEIPNTGMAISIDLGDPRDVHPRNKQPVGERLALWALGTTYGKDIVYSGPLPKRREPRHQNRHTMVLTFDHAGEGLSTRDGKVLCGFEICAADGTYRPATARIDGDSVILSHPRIATPTAARYAWAPFPDGNLINSAGLPASPFRTDTSTWRHQGPRRLPGPSSARPSAAGQGVRNGLDSAPEFPQNKE